MHSHIASLSLDLSLDGLNFEAFEICVHPIRERVVKQAKSRTPSDMFRPYLDDQVVDYCRFDADGGLGLNCFSVSNLPWVQNRYEIARMNVPTARRIERSS